MNFPRVCMMTSVHRHDDIRIYHKEAKTLKRAGYDVTILCPDYQGQDENGINFRKAAVPRSRLGRMAGAWRRMAQAAAELDCQIYHIHDPELLPAAFWLKEQGKIVVYDAHEDTPKQILSKPYWNFAARKAAAKAVELMEHRAGTRLDQVFTATSTIARRYQNGVALENFPIVGEFPPHLLTPYQNRPAQVCYVGAITENRGILTMVQAVQSLPVRLHLAGEFENPQLRQLAKQQDRAGKIKWHGTLDRENVVRLMGRSRVGLLLLKPTPSYVQSYPIKLFEYLLAATPVVLSDFTLWREIVGKENALFVPPQDNQKIQDAILYLLNHPKEAEEMALAGQKRAMERFLFPEKRLVDQYQYLWRRKGQ